MKWLGILLVALGLGAFLWSSESENKILSPLISLRQEQAKQRTFDQYSFENLARREYRGSKINLEKQISQEEKYTSWLFSYQSDGKKVTGMANLPVGDGPFPVIIMLRGYADKEIYFTGLGTRKAAGVFAENGFLTLAPDFLGFGGSDWESADILEARFERPITVLNLIASIKNIPQAKSEQIFLLGHSNGGQIALSVLEISGKNYPTTLWAPVTESFPESIVGYINKENLTPESEKVLEAVENFKKDYDPRLYSITNFWKKINAPLQIHQGGADEWVPKEWQEKAVGELKKLNKKIDYYFYPSSDHNLKQDWDEAVKRDVVFFKGL